MLPPPKPTRYPGSEIEESNTSVAPLDRSQQPPLPVSSYIVAQNAEVLVHLLKENESRGLNPSVYTTPASAFNTIAVDFKENTGGSGVGEFASSDKTLSAGDSLQSLASLSSSMSLGAAAHLVPACTEPRLDAAAAAARPDSFVNIAGDEGAAAMNGSASAAAAAAAALFNKSLPRNFGYGGGKLSAAHAVLVAYGPPRKSFSTSSGEINEPPVSYRSVRCRIPHRMSRSVDSWAVAQAACAAIEVR